MEVPYIQPAELLELLRGDASGCVKVIDVRDDDFAGGALS